MNPRSATVAASFYPTIVIAGWALVSVTSMGSTRIETTAAVQVVDRIAPALAANVEFATAPRPTVMSYVAAGHAEAATATEFMARPIPDMTTPADEPQLVTTAADEPQLATSAADEPQPARTAAAEPQPVTTAADEPQPVATVADTPQPVTTVVDAAQPFVVAALTDPAEVLSPETLQAPPASTADAPPQDVATTPSRVELVGECQVAEACIDQFLWALYERTRKEDTTKEREFRKVQIKRKGKLVTVTRSFTRLVENDFTWKDPHAAARVGMSMPDYVIGGMDRSFKQKLFRTLYAAEAAGLQPGITSAFRDDYRQSIASGLKAASNRSFHGGSLRGGYGHGLAADIVSVNGATRAKRWVSTEILWKWVDANGKQYGIGRPYLGRDPPHVGPIDGGEYASKRGGARTAVADAKKRGRVAVHGKPSAAKRPVVARTAKGRTV